MRNTLIASVAALALIAGSVASATPAKADGCGAGCWATGGGVGLGLLGLGAYLIINKDAPAGSLRAKADPVHESFLANQKQFQGTPAYAFVNTGSNVAQVK